MTYYEEDGRGEVVPELGLRFGGGDVENGGGEGGGGYVKLRGGPAECGPESTESPAGTAGGSWWYWARLVLLLVCAGVLAGVFFKWIGPFFMDKATDHVPGRYVEPEVFSYPALTCWDQSREIIPLIHWETTTFSPPVLAVLVFASVAIFPTLLLPSSPSMWVAGMTFGYGFGFLLIISGAAVGISLPYFIGSLFHHKILGWLEKYPKRASILRSAGEGNWLHQFRAVILIRVSPFPYIIYNYCAVATDVKYGPYFFGSLVGMVPEIFVTIYTGIIIRTLADASAESHGLSAPQIIFTALGFCGATATTVFFTVYAKSKLKQLQNEDELLLQ